MYLDFNVKTLMECERSFTPSIALSANFSAFSALRVFAAFALHVTVSVMAILAWAKSSKRSPSFNFHTCARMP